MLNFHLDKELIPSPVSWFPAQLVIVHTPQCDVQVFERKENREQVKRKKKCLFFKEEWVGGHNEKPLFSISIPVPIPIPISVPVPISISIPVPVPISISISIPILVSILISSNLSLLLSKILTRF
jgi:hypothetical protein